MSFTLAMLIARVAVMTRVVDVSTQEDVRINVRGVKAFNIFVVDSARVLTVEDCAGNVIARLRYDAVQNRYALIGLGDSYVK